MKKILCEAMVDGFNKHHWSHILFIQVRIMNDIRTKNVEKVKEWLSFCLQQWPKLKGCPISPVILREAYNTIVV